jgi:hypothetical protein
MIPLLTQTNDQSLLIDEVTTYLNRDDVRDALNIPDNIQPWLGCQTDI